MAESRGTPVRPQRHPPSRLAILTWTLVALLAVWFAVWYVFYRPTSEHQKRVAAFGMAMQYIAENYVAEVDQEQLYRAAMSALVDALGDPHSHYVTPSQSQRMHEDTQGEFGGIGVVVRPSDGLLLILEVLPETPARRAGLEAGDLITHVDGHDVKELALEAAADMIKGPVGTEVELRLTRPGLEEPLVKRIKRDKITIVNVRSRMLEDGIGTLRVAGFDRNCAREVERELREMQAKGLRALILDVRGNPGGLVEQAEELCDMFLNHGLIVAVQGRVQPLRIRHADERVVVPLEMPIVVLVDGWTASAAEIVAGALQANGRATVIGAPTVGKGSINSLFALPDKSAVVLTVARYMLAGGRAVEGHGIAPDIVIGQLPPLPENADEEKMRQWLEGQQKAAEEQMEAAVKFLRDRLTQGNQGATGQ